MCSIDSSAEIHTWKIPSKEISGLYSNLEKDHEIAGKLDVHVDQKSTGKFTIVKGNKDSVEAPVDIVNYHTHPAPCYVGESTVWGWPSGEDFRETVIFGLKGCVAHLVLSIEGVYVLQVNPCILENLCNLDQTMNLASIKKLFPKDIVKKYKNESLYDLLRGVIIIIIEIFFRSTHAFRAYDFNEEHSQVYPDDFIKFCNAFKMNNVFLDNELENCGELRCNGIWTYDNNLYERLNFKKYINEYENETTVYLCDKHGETSNTHTKLKSLFKGKNKLIDFIKNLKLGTNCKYPKQMWNDFWFQVSLVPNEVFINNKWVMYTSPDINNNQKVDFLKHFTSSKIRKTTQDPIFYFFKMSGDCTYSDVKKDISNTRSRNTCSIGSKRSRKRITRTTGTRRSLKKFGKSNKKHKLYVLIGSSECLACNNLKDLLDKKKIVYQGIIFPEIKDAIKFASRLFGVDIKNIPVLFDLRCGSIIDHRYV
jgi:hypothetical protein